MAHDYHPRQRDAPTAATLVADPEPILFDGCQECEEKAEKVLYAFDHEFSAALWQKMVAVEHRDEGSYRSQAERQACVRLYEVAVFLERHTRLDPWTLFDDTKEALR